ncbi:MAG: AMP-binding protein [Burkholderiales bacterium]|nr:AMP-binding protein [Burkholderiales bacterium]
MQPSGYADGFARANLPPPSQWPELIFELPELAYPPRLNCAAAFVDAHVAAGRGAHAALVGARSVLSYADLLALSNRIARVLVEDMGLVSGSRVLLRSGNNPELAACWLGVLKAGCIAVTTMPLLRARELAAIVEKAEIAAALCDHALADEMRATQAACARLRHVMYFNAPPDSAHALEPRASRKPPTFANLDSAADDVALIAFTSGTTGVPKGTLHFHRDVLAICDVLSRQVIAPAPHDVFIGTPPLAFTFGLGGLFLFPLRVGATGVLVEQWTPESLLAGIARHRATICFTAPTFYRRMAPLAAAHDLSSLRVTVSSGEMLPADTRAAWREASGLEMTECLGSTELLHAFIACRPGAVRPGATGRVVPGYRAAVLGEDGRPVPPGTVGRLAVKGPTGCRYLADARQTAYVQDGWNLTGDAYRMDEDGYFWYQSRTDDMIISAGYNIAGPEVEDVLLTHPAVAECGVVGVPDAERGQIVKAFVVLRPGRAAGEPMARELQDLVKATLAPYKYPRAVQFVAALPRTENGKIQRYKLRRGELA